MKIKARINVTQIKWDDKKVAAALARDAGIGGQMLQRANSIASDAQDNIRGSVQKPVPKSMQSAANAALGTHFSEKPDAIAKQVSVGGQEGPFIVTRNQAGRDIPVALVVADHPFSSLYYGAMVAAVSKNRGRAWKLRRP